MTVATSATELVVARTQSSYSPTQHPVSYTVTIHPWFDVDFQRGAGFWTVVDRQTGIFGDGSELTDAIRDFERAVREHLEILERQEALSEELASQLDYLRRRLR